MKLNLPKEWFEENLPYDNPEVGVGVPGQVGNQQCESEESSSYRKDEDETSKRSRPGDQIN